MRLHLRRARLSLDQTRRAQPRLEILEDRVVPEGGPSAGQVFWINPNSGDWDVASNWSQGQVPTSVDQVVIDVPKITVTHSQGVNDAVASLTSLATLNLTGGSLAVNGNSSVSALQVNGGTLMLGNGTLQAASFVENAGVTRLAGGNLASNQVVQILGGELVGFGQIQADLENDGLVKPAGGDLVVDGNYQQSSAAVLQIPTVPSGSNLLTVDGNANLDGELQVLCLRNLSSESEGIDPVLLADTVTNTFAVTDLQSPPRSASVVYDPSDVVVVVDESTLGQGANPTNPPGPAGPGVPGQPPPLGGPGPGNGPGGPRSPNNPFGTATVQEGIAANQGAQTGGPPARAQAGGGVNQGAQTGGGANPGAQPGGGANPGAQPGGGQAGPGAPGGRPPGIANSGSSILPPPVGQNPPSGGPPSAMRDTMFDRRGMAERLEDGGDEDLVGAFATVFDLDLSTGSDTSLGVEAAVSLLAGGSQRAAVLPQRGSSVAAVATLLADDDSPRQEETVVTDGLDQLLINPLWRAPAAWPDQLLPAEILPEADVEGQTVRTVPWWQSLILAPVLAVGAVFERMREER
jgi:hypothetical protein